MRGVFHAAAAVLLAACAVPIASSQNVRPAPAISGVTFERQVAPFAVALPDGRELALPFLGGLDVPRPQFVDIDGDGDLDLFMQEYSNTLWFLENTGTAKAPRYTWRADRFQNLDIGDWYRFVDITGDILIEAYDAVRHVILQSVVATLPRCLSSRSGDWPRCRRRCHRGNTH